MTLLAIILAFAVFHYVEKPKGLRSFDFLTALDDFLEKTTHVSVQQVRFVLLILLPLLVLGLLLELIHVDGLHGHSIWFLVVHVLVLFYLLGPSAMDSDVAEATLMEQLGLTESSTAEETIHAMTDASLKRWFGVLFWYLILGLWGALIFRLCERVAALKDRDELVKQWASCLLVILSYPVAILMTVALAVSGDFDKVWHKWKPFFNWDSVQNLKTQFLYDAMVVSVNQDEATGDSEADDDNEADDEDHQETVVVDETLALLKRMLVACLVFVALLVLFSVR